MHSDLGHYKEIQEFKLNISVKDNCPPPHTNAYVSLIRVLEFF